MIRVDTGSLRATLLSIRNTRVSEQKAAAASVRIAGTILLGVIKSTMGLTDHSLKDLAQHSPPHPYSKLRYGSIRIHTSSRSSSLGPIIKPPTHQVHVQSGQLIRTLKGAPSSRGGAKGYGYRVSVDPARAPHAIYVIQGTKKMHARDVLWSTANALGTRRIMMKGIVRVLGAGLRAQAVVRFETLQRGPGAPTEV